MTQVYKAKCIISRGRKNEIQPGTLFVPASDEQRDELIGLKAIEEASEQELALYEKMNGGETKPKSRGRGRPKKEETQSPAGDESDESDDDSDAADGDVVG